MGLHQSLLDLPHLLPLLPPFLPRQLPLLLPPPLPLSPAQWIAASPLGNLIPYLWLAVLGVAKRATCVGRAGGEGGAGKRMNQIKKER